jgi:predicted Ser/Thr protein kinase
LQHEIRRSTAKSQALEWVDELNLTEVLGKGGFGIVYKGVWLAAVLP